ncbi:hypothetical protein AEYBE204_12220 [Asticcacaulis sp. YBE204]|nr:hypothetical protein AEYBE204_12220 [Asticcacaulis sp. YBE204]
MDLRTEPDLTEAAVETEPPILVGNREQLFHLLAEASEIEHALMCSYLYALFSLKPAADPSFSHEESTAVARWRETIRSVVIEEMGHLVIVSNLTAALGGRPHFNRPNFPVTSGYFPSVLSLRLTPFSLETLDHFIFLERPLGVEVPDGEGFEVRDAPPREQVFHGLMPGAQDYATVSHLYEAIRANLIGLARLLGEAHLFIGAAASQMGANVIKMKGVREISTLEDALKSIDIIVEQGEGASVACDDCHYSRFVAIRDEFLELSARNEKFRPAYPMVSNPVTRRPEASDERVYISNPEAAQVLDFGNATYNLLLRALVQAFCQNRSDATQERFMTLALGLMHVLSSVAQTLASIPATEGGRLTAGLTFTTLRGLEPLATGEVETILIQERLLLLIAATRDICPRHPAFAAVLTQIQNVLEGFCRR